MHSPVLVELCGAAKHYRLYASPAARVRSLLLGKREASETVAALQPLDIQIRRGESVAFVGRNGSGKSTLLQLVAGVLKPSAGSVDVTAKLAALLELGAGFNPEFTGRENALLNATLLGLSEAEAARRLPAIADFADIGDFLERPVKTYSSGMFVRLAFAVAINVEAEILVVDEALSVGDEAFQRKCFARIQDLQARGVTIIFVSHSAAAVLELATRAVLLDRGEMIADGAPKEVISFYHRMLAASAEERRRMRGSFPGTGTGTGNDQESGRFDAPAAPHDSYDPSLRSASAVAYEERGAAIRDVELRAVDGRIVNLVTSGSRYVFCYRVTFSQDAEKVRFGMLIKTVRGIELGGATSASPHQVLDFVPAGSSVTVTFDFSNVFNTGVYFVNAGVAAVCDGEETYIARIEDALAFRVLPQGDPLPNGVVNLSVQCALHVDAR